MATTIIASYAGGGTLWNPGVEVQPDDAVIWFYREASSVGGPTGRMCQLADSGGTSIGALYYNKGNWGAYAPYNYYITSFYGNLEFDSGGNYVVDDTIYVVFDQFTSFTAGNHYVKFNLPGVSRARVEAAHLLRGVIPETPGTFKYSFAESPNYSRFYSETGTTVSNSFPITVPLTADSSIVYLLWQMYDSVQPPAGYTSVNGTSIASYTYIDPTDNPTTMIQAIISYRAGLTGAGVSIPAPSESGASGVGVGTGYNVDAVVINGTETVAPIGPTVYFADMIVFNAQAGAAVEF